MLLQTLILISVVFTSVYEAAKLDPVEYLKRYGYLNKGHGYSSSSSSLISNAIKHMQSFGHIPQTGNLDRATLKLMNSPRCGVTDVDTKHGYAGVRKWNHNDLTYKFDNYTPDLPIPETERIIREAFQLWADFIPLNFYQINTTGDFSIVFGRYSHNGGWGGRGRCNARFDGRGGVLAHAYFPKDGRAHFDEDETFTDKTHAGVNLFWVAAHEFGHALGLPHSKVRGALMYPYYTGFKDNFMLPNDDITRIQRIYGPRVTLGPGETYPPTTKPIYTRPINTYPENCVDTYGEKFCKARISVCHSSHDGWRTFMKNRCYKTCYCDRAPPPSNAPTEKPTDPVKPETLKPTNKGITTVTSPVKTATKNPVTKATGAVCFDKAGRYCVGHAKRCGTEDPVWKDYLIRNCFKTCFC